MNQLDFSSVMAVIRYYISPDHGMNQAELLDELFYGLHAESKEPITLIRDWLEPLESLQMFKRILLLPNRLAHAVKLGKAFLLFANKFIEILQRADASFLHEELYLNYQRYGTFAHIYAGQPEDKAYNWSIGHVKCILKNEVYIGHSVHNQQTNISFKNKKKVRKPEDEWFKVENTHEAIISEEDFRRVQEMIDTRRRSQKNGELQLFAGLIKCADCGWSLGHGRRKTKNGYDSYYHCSKNGQGLHQCSMHYIRDDVLCAYVLSRLQYWSQQAQQNEEKLLNRLMGATDRERNAAKKKQAAKLHKAEGMPRTGVPHEAELSRTSADDPSTGPSVFVHQKRSRHFGTTTRTAEALAMNHEKPLHAHSIST